MKREFTHLTTGLSTSLHPLFRLISLSILFSFLTFASQAEENSASFEPCCMIPHDREVGCDVLGYGFDPYDIWQLQELFGAPHAYGSCPNYYVTELTPYVNLNSCDLGTITRRFEVVNPYDYYGDPYICTQQVVIKGVHDYEIRFPADEIAFCTTPDPDPIQYNELSCDLLAVSTNDLIFNTAVDACFKILRTYRVINWCEYDGSSPPLIISRDEDCDGIPGDEAVWVQRRINDIVYTDRSSVQFDNIPSYIELDPSCGHDGVPGYWRRFFVAEGYPYYNQRGFYQYTQHIKVTDDIKPEINYNPPQAFCSFSSNFAAGCPGPVEIPFSIVENCTDQATIKVFLFAFNQPVPLTSQNDLFDEIVTGSFPNYVIQGSFPIGSHSFEIHVNDGCGNSNSRLIPFQVVDCKAPAPVCIHGLSTSLMPLEPGTDVNGDGVPDPGAMAIWANDFIGSDIYDCTGPITYSINRVGETPDRSQDGIILTCDDRDTAFVELYAWDSAFNPYSVQPDGTVGGPNYDHCKTYVRLTDNLGLCPNVVIDPPTVTLLGAIHTPQDSMLEDVEVHLEGDTSDMMMTTVEGEFEFEILQMGMDYEINPEKDGDDAEGLNNLDLIVLGKHLMGVDTLDSPYQLIAADVDNNQTIDINDFLALRRVVLGLDSAFLNNSSWRFVAEDFTFSDASNPWAEPFPESIILDSLDDSREDLNFIAIKIGDLDGSVMKDAEAELDFNNTPVIARSRAEGESELRAILLALNITDYDAGTAQMDLTNGQSAPNHLEVKPVWPNPFKQTANISFSLSKGDFVSIAILDLNGKMIYQTRKYYPAGAHTEQLEFGPQHSAGVYYCRLQSADEIRSQRIVKTN